MRFLPLVPILLLAACATTPDEAPAPAPTRVEPRGDHRHGDLIGLGVRELGDLFGAPVFQVREGPGLKLQYRGGDCILDTYLYPPPSGQGVERVTHVEARLPSGVSTDAAACEAAIEAAG